MNAFDQVLKGNAPSFREVITAAGIVAATDVTVLLSGESGTGKELMARAIHETSPRHKGPFVSINCASLTEQLADSLMFGHRKGAFTGAVSDHIGHIRFAHRGTLFLDEVAELPSGTQAKLLRFLESGECLPVGELSVVRADVRVIAATNRDLEEEVRTGRFRRDLYFRLNVVPLTLPPLRERREDIQSLLTHFVARSAAGYGLQAPRFDRAAMHLLRDYSWPGNVRELRNLAERMVVLLHGRGVTAENLPAEIRRSATDRPTRCSGYVLPEEGVVMDDLEAEILRQALQRTGGNRSRAARLLGLTRDTFLYRMKKYAIA